MIHSCEKDQWVLSEDKIPVTKPRVFNLEDLTAGLTLVKDLSKSEISAERNNPYTVENIKLAYETVMKTAYTGQATHNYVVFSPVTNEELELLVDEDLLFLDYPWTAEVIKPGQYYHVPQHEADFPQLYTVVEVGYVFPHGISYNIIDALDLSDYSLPVLELAYKNTANEDVFDRDYKTRKKCESTDGPVVIDDEPQVCGSTGGGNGSDGFVINDCGCEVYQDVRKPGGCVRVDDTHLNAIGDTDNFAGVRRIRVYARDSWFKLKKTYTDDNGCWRINARFSGNGWFYFRLKSSDRGKIRSSFFENSGTIDAIRIATGEVDGPFFNDIQVNVPRRGTPFNSSGDALVDELLAKRIHEVWAGCMVNNALHEFHDYATAEGIAPPPKNLNILINAKQRRGFAGMMRQVGESNFLDAVTSGFINANADSDLEEVGRFVGGVIGRIGVDITLPLSYPLIRTYVGDVTIGADFGNSDALKRLAYHEFCHTSHFQTVGTSYWMDVIRAEVAAGGHGTQFGPDAGLISLVESWAEHIALSMMVEWYGDAVSLEMEPFSGPLFQSWDDRLEFIHNTRQNHIPIGFYNDLIDPVRPFSDREKTYTQDLDRAVELGIIPLARARDTLFRNVNDQVGGYSNNFFGQSLTANVQTMAQLEAIVLGTPLNNIPTNLQRLLNDY